MARKPASARPPAATDGPAPGSPETVPPVPDTPPATDDLAPGSPEAVPPEQAAEPTDPVDLIRDERLAYRVLSPLKFDGRRYGPGDTVHMRAEDAVLLLDAGDIGPAEGLDEDED